jgi:hypothetical protein
MRLKRATASEKPSLQEAEAGALATAARKPFRARAGTGVSWRSNSSNRLCASSGLSFPERACSVAASRTTWGARREGGEVEVEEERRRRYVGAVEWRRDMGLTLARRATWGSL